MLTFGTTERFLVYGNFFVKGSFDMKKGLFWRIVLEKWSPKKKDHK